LFYYATDTLDLLPQVTRSFVIPALARSVVAVLILMVARIVLEVLEVIMVMMMVVDVDVLGRAAVI
jgi:hypothetical protein